MSVLRSYFLMGDLAMEEYINLSRDNLDTEDICCIVRVKNAQLGISSKKNWLFNRIDEGLVFRKLKGASQPVFIEYAPLETAFVPIVGNNYMYIYCLWAAGEYKGQGYGKALLRYAIDDAKSKGKSGVCVLGSNKQGSWLTDQKFVEHFGFEVVDTTSTGYNLLALSFDGSKPSFSPTARAGKIDSKGLIVYYTYQCPYIYERLGIIARYCVLNNVEYNFELVDSVEKAKTLPCPFNNIAVFYKGKLQTTNMPDIHALDKMVRK